MKSLNFLEKFKEPIVKGTKTQTSRRSKKNIERGDVIYANFAHMSIGIRVCDVYKKRLGDFDEDDALREGCSSLLDFQEVWRRIHYRDGWNPNQNVWVIRFKLNRRIEFNDDCGKEKK